MSQVEAMFEGQCFCGAVKIVVTGEAAGAGYCHCANCRSWSAGPVNAFTLWPTEAVRVAQGEEHIGEYHISEQSYRQWCKVCGGHILTRHPTWGMVDVYAATIPTFPFTPGIGAKAKSIPLFTRFGHAHGPEIVIASFPWLMSSSLILYEAPFGSTPALIKAMISESPLIAPPFATPTLCKS